MKKLTALLAALALAFFAFPALAADASAEVDTITEVEAPAPEAAEITCDAETVDFPLTFDLAVPSTEGCNSCCDLCLRLSAKNYCTWNCGCEC